MHTPEHCNKLQLYRIVLHCMEKLTQTTAVDFRTKGNEDVPPLWIDSNVLTDDWIRQIASHDGIIVKVSLNHLLKRKRRPPWTTKELKSEQ